MVEVDGRYYPEGATPEDRQAQYEMCEDLAHQGVDYCKRKLLEGVVADPAAALDRLYKGVQRKGWCSPAQCGWIVRRVAALQDWKAPQF